MNKYLRPITKTIDCTKDYTNFLIYYVCELFVPECWKH